ncbi:hypothetical protein ACQP3F_32035, partial [Escherichia coli]
VYLYRKTTRTFCLYLMRQNTEGNQLILKFSRLEKNGLPLSNAKFKLFIPITLPSEGKVLGTSWKPVKEGTHKPSFQGKWVYSVFV